MIFMLKIDNLQVEYSCCITLAQHWPNVGITTLVLFQYLIDVHIIVNTWRTEDRKMEEGRKVLS